MATVIYRGEVKELQGQQFEVPASVLKANQAASWIESTWREENAREVARIEAERRQEELLAARLEQQRQQAEADRMAMAEAAGADVKAAVEEQFRVELADLTQALLTGAAAVQAKEEVIIQRTAEWDQRHESLVAGSEAAVNDAREQVTHAQAVTESTRETLLETEADREERFQQLEGELRSVVSGLVGPQGEKGERGLAGSGVGYVDGDPRRIEQRSLGQRMFGRAVVPGDLLLQRTPDALLVWRTADGKTWKQVDEILNKQELVSQQLQISDRSTNVVGTSIIQNGTAASRSGGAQPPLLPALPKGGAAMVFESTEAAKRNRVSNAFTAQLCLICTDPSSLGESVTVLITGTCKGGAIAAETEYALVGARPGFAGLLNLNITAQVSAPSDPKGTTDTLKVFIGATGLFDGAALQGWVLFTEAV